ncbi:MAG: hypothetical protein HZC54_08495 [Verrucomicrobia bacterium]|nr:hypothetical protein [Verrucomicrobiota bacterium]
MKKLYIIAAVITVLGTVGAAVAAGQAQVSLKAGDTAFVCGCGPKCGCSTVSLKEGKCACGHDLAKVTVSKVKGATASYEADGKAKTMKLTGKYVCACGTGCCQMVSNKPGKCACGKDMTEAGKK